MKGIVKWFNGGRKGHRVGADDYCLACGVDFVTLWKAGLFTCSCWKIRLPRRAGMR
jgi:hypothetical protein